MLLNASPLAGSSIQHRADTQPSISSLLATRFADRTPGLRKNKELGDTAFRDTVINSASLRLKVHESSEPNRCKPEISVPNQLLNLELHKESGWIGTLAGCRRTGLTHLGAEKTYDQAITVWRRFL